MMGVPKACGGKGEASDADDAPALGVPKPCGRKGRLMMLMTRLPWACLGLVQGRAGLMMRLPWACLGCCGGKGGANDADDALALGVPKPCGGNVGANDADAAPALGVLRLLWREGRS